MPDGTEIVSIFALAPMRPIYRSISKSVPDHDGKPVVVINRPKGLCILDPSSLELIYGPSELEDIERLVEIISPPQSRNSIRELPEVLVETEIIISGWGGPLLDEEFLDCAPRLKAVFYGSGAVSPIITDSVWERKIVVTSAYAANAVPVAEYTIATILFSLKHGWRMARIVRDLANFRAPSTVPGCYGTTVGLVSMGMVARTLLKHLSLCDLDVVVYDPYLDQTEADALGVELVSLDELFRRSDVVSVHTFSC
jgi:phosphoglycerate dehydrogenase-like enzyme